MTKSSAGTGVCSAVASCIGERPVERLLLLDPGLFYEGGHHAPLARLVRDEAARRGIETIIHGARRVDHPPSDLRIRNTFRDSAYARLDPASPAESLLGCNRRIKEDLLDSVTPEILPGTVVFAPTVTSRLALALAEWAGSLDHTGVPLAMVLMFPPGRSGDEAMRRAETELYAMAMGELARLPPGRVALFAETEPIAAAFERLGAPRIHTLPWPVWSMQGTVEARTRSASLHIVHLGHTKADRGIGLLAESLPGLLEACPDAHCTIQANYWDPVGVEHAVRALESMGPRVQVLRGPLEPRRYAALIADADIVALPYDPAHYRDLGSGVFAEAAAAGRIVVAPDHTWLAEQSRKWGLGVVLFDRHDPASFGAALREAVAGRDMLMDRAEHARPAWTRDRSVSMFLDRIFEALAREGARGHPEVCRSVRVKPDLATACVGPAPGIDRLCASPVRIPEPPNAEVFP